MPGSTAFQYASSTRRIHLTTTSCLATCNRLELGTVLNFFCVEENYCFNKWLSALIDLGSSLTSIPLHSLLVLS